MTSTITASAVVVLLGLWHVRNRRHAGWQASANGRFFVLLGYPLAAVGAYWFSTAPGAAAWEWAMGCAWVSAAALSFTLGFRALRRVTAEHARAAIALETIATTGALPT